MKYFWAQTVWVLEKEGRFLEFQARLNSLEKSGLNIASIMGDYMCRFRGGLIGKHFKTISQVMSFAVSGLVRPELCNTWRAVGHLTVLLWETEIDNITDYLVCVCFLPNYPPHHLYSAHRKHCGKLSMILSTSQQPLALA